MKRSARLHVFGIRHHGPGSARSLLTALDKLRPDLILIEGPPDANGVLHYGASPLVVPPIAILTYSPEHLRFAAYFPLSSFSPEWNAIQFAFKHGIPVRFMDLPQAYRMALMVEGAQALDIPTQPEPPTPQPDNLAVLEIERLEPEIHEDPLYWMAKAAGYNDGERWWDDLVEQRRDTTDLFRGILQAMAELRDAAGSSPDPLGDYREAYMRKIIRAALYEGFERIAVVCGAWHAPRLAEMPSARGDQALLRALPRLPAIQAAWVPWTHGRLARFSGYGAGVVSPGWYHYLWTTRDHGDEIATGWITKIARLLREQDLDASPAQIIDAVRLAESLAALRDRPAPGLSELNEAALAVFCFGNSRPLQLIYKSLIVGELMGSVPQDAPTAPLQRDLTDMQRRLKLTPRPEQEALELDLREQIDRERSHLLHRLALLGIYWGILGPSQNNQPASAFGGSSAKPGGSSLLRRIQQQGGLPPQFPGQRPNALPPAPHQLPAEETGTAREVWKLVWQPEFVVRLIEASIWGNTIAEAAAGYVRHAASTLDNLPALTRMLERALMADLPDVIDALLERLRDRAALSSDIAHLMDTLMPLARVLRYGNARQTDKSIVRHVIDSVVPRICINLPSACTFVNGNAALELLSRVMTVNAALHMLRIEPHVKAWYAALITIASRQGISPLLAGRACRLLFEAGQFTADETLRRAGLILARAEHPTYTAFWLDGFIRGSGLNLLFDEALFGLLDGWLRALPREAFDALLPILRRTFATFSGPERRQIGERARRLAENAPGDAGAEVIDTEQADKLIPTLALLLGVS